MGVVTGPVVAELYRYPVKGLSAEALTEVTLRAGDGVPDDRVFALALPDTEFDEDRPAALHKTRFLMLQRDETLARVRTRYDAATGQLGVDDGIRRWSADLTTAAGRRAVEEYFGSLAASTAGTGGVAGGIAAAATAAAAAAAARTADAVGPAVRATDDGDAAGRARRLPRLVEARGGHRFTDTGPNGPDLMRSISVINLASVRDLAERIGQPVHPLRFRANVYVDGLPAWAERDWIGQEIALGAVPGRVLSTTRRCAATTVNPDTAERDIKIVKELADHFGHTECGVYVQVRGAGTVSLGDPVTPPTRA